MKSFRCVSAVLALGALASCSSATTSFPVLEPKPVSGPQSPDKVSASSRTEPGDADWPFPPLEHFQDVDRGDRPRPEGEIVPEADPAPIQRFLASQLEVTGNWKSSFLYSNWGFSIRPAVATQAGDAASRRPGQAGDYDVMFFDAACLYQRAYLRRATYKDGVLVLDRPVRSIGVGAFSVVYAVHLGGQEVLIPASLVSYVPSEERSIQLDEDLPGRAAVRWAPEH